MNKVILMGRLTRDPEIRYAQNGDQMAIARFTLAVDRRFKRDGENTADFISCVAFGRTAEFLERYVRQGTKLCLEGRIQTGSYVRQDGTKVYTTEVVVENAEFAESKAAASGGAQTGGYNNNQQRSYGSNAPYQQAPMPQNGQIPFGGQQSYGGQSGYNSQPSYGSQPAQNAQPSYGGQPSFMEPPTAGPQPASDPAAEEEGFMDIQDALQDDELPFN